MSAPNYMMMNILRIITPEEIGEITTKHNGGKFISLTELIDERFDKNVIRNFAEPQEFNQTEAKILPFKKNSDEITQSPNETEINLESEETILTESLESVISEDSQSAVKKTSTDRGLEHNEEENMSSFILIEKERFKKSQLTLKKKEIMELYQQTAKAEVEQLRHSNQNMNTSTLDGVLVNKKQY